MEMKRQVNMLRHAMSDKASYADLQAVVSSLADKFPPQAAEDEANNPQVIPRTP